MVKNELKKEKNGLVREVKNKPLLFLLIFLTEENRFTPRREHILHKISFALIQECGLNFQSESLPLHLFLS